MIVISMAFIKIYMNDGAQPAATNPRAIVSSFLYIGQPLKSEDITVFIRILRYARKIWLFYFHKSTKVQQSFRGKVARNKRIFTLLDKDLDIFINKI